MKARHALFFIAVGFCLEFTGSYLRIIHRGGANQLMLAALFLKLAGVILLAWKTVRYSGFRKFLDS